MHNFFFVLIVHRLLVCAIHCVHFSIPREYKKQQQQQKNAIHKYQNEMSHIRVVSFSTVFMFFIHFGMTRLCALVFLIERFADVFAPLKMLFANWQPILSEDCFPFRKKSISIERKCAAHISVGMEFRLCLSNYKSCWVQSMYTYSHTIRYPIQIIPKTIQSKAICWDKWVWIFWRELTKMTNDSVSPNVKYEFKCRVRRWIGVCVILDFCFVRLCFVRR